MKLLHCFLLALCLGASAQGQREGEGQKPIVAPALQRVISTDERVLVFAKNRKTAGAVLIQITALREELNFILRDPTEKNKEVLIPIQNDLVVTLFGEIGDAPKKRPFSILPRAVEGSNRFRIELNVDLSRGINRERFREKVIECILMDRSLNENVRNEQPIKVAPWLVTGLLERMAWRNGEADRGLYKSLFKRGLMMDMEEVVTLANPAQLDAAERTVFRVSAGAFLMSQLNQDGGIKSFLDYLDIASSHEGDPFLLFRTSFYTAGLSDEGLAKQWALQLANLTQEFVTETLTPLETEQALNEVLQGILDHDDGSPRHYRLIAYQDILALPEKERRLLLGPMLERINLLSFRCFPSYREMLSGYARITTQLVEGNDQDIIELLTILEEKRTALKKVGVRTRDYLDWFQIANATELTGEFSEYQKLKRELETELAPHPGPIDRYLNAVQKLYGEKE